MSELQKKKGGKLLIGALSTQNAAGFVDQVKGVEKLAAMYPDRFQVVDTQWIAASPVSVTSNVRDLLEKKPDVVLIGGTTAQVIATANALDELGAQKLQRVLLFLALSLGNDDDGAISERLGNQRQADAGIAGRALDDHAPRAQLALADRILDDEQGGAILDRLARIHEFGLAENRATGHLGGALETDERRMADGLNDSVANLHETKDPAD